MSEPGSRPPLIDARAVCLAHGTRHVLTEVDLTIRPGDFWFFLGNNGQGKSTLLNCLMGLHAPASGRVTESPEAGVARTGYVPQRCGMNPTLPTTVREFVELGLVGLRLSAADRAGRVAQALTQVDLAGAACRSYWALSGGERQRTLLARALARRPALLVLDEPTNSLDYAVQELLMQLLARCQQEHGMAVVMVSHDVPLAARFATHVALFRDGRVASGPRAAMLTPKNLLETFGVVMAGGCA